MRVLCAIAVVSCTLVLAGCAGAPVMTTTETQPAAVQGAALHGMVHGGQQPISGAHVYLFAADATGYGKASDSLLTSSVTAQIPPGGQDGSGNWYAATSGTGSFSITGDYTCPSASAQVYLYAVGGDQRRESRIRLQACWLVWDRAAL